MRAHLFIVCGLFALGLIAALPFLALSYSGGAPSGFSGPVDTCNACHGVFGEVNTGTGSITITAPSTFTEGMPIPITVTVDNTTPPVGPTPRQGFMLSARNDALEHVGEFDLNGSTLVRFGEGNNPANDSLYVTQTSSSSEMTTWTFLWIAPTESAPNIVTLYASGNASNSDGVPDSGDMVYVTAHSMTRVTVDNEPNAIPAALSMEAVSPNPFRSGAEVRYTLDRAAVVRVLLRDGRGRTVREIEHGPRTAGEHRLRISAAGLAAGVYFLSIAGPDGVQTRPLVVNH